MNIESVQLVMSKSKNINLVLENISFNILDVLGTVMYVA